MSACWTTCTFLVFLSVSKCKIVEIEKRKVCCFVCTLLLCWKRKGRMASRLVDQPLAGVTRDRMSFSLLNGALQKSLDSALCQVNLFLRLLSLSLSLPLSPAPSDCLTLSLSSLSNSTSNSPFLLDYLVTTLGSSHLLITASVAAHHRSTASLCSPSQLPLYRLAIFICSALLCIPV